MYFDVESHIDEDSFQINYMYTSLHYQYDENQYVVILHFKSIYKRFTSFKCLCFILQQLYPTHLSIIINRTWYIFSISRWNRHGDTQIKMYHFKCSTYSTSGIMEGLLAMFSKDTNIILFLRNIRQTKRNICFQQMNVMSKYGMS